GGKKEISKKATTIAHWMLGDFTRLLNSTGKQIGDSRVQPGQLAELLELIEKGTLSGPLAKTVFEEMFETGKSAAAVVAEKGLVQISDSGELGIIIERVIADNGKAVADYRAGKEASLTFLIGQVMKASRGKANPAVVRPIIVDKLGGN
ncbi:MAG: Asp-tRNA(Asn)/Glu-tRNA(Gln) amidotransferase GatCAB subunit B, partial [Dehalococcoidia bacterium]